MPDDASLKMASHCPGGASRAAWSAALGFADDEAACAFDPCEIAPDLRFVV